MTDCAFVTYLSSLTSGFRLLGIFVGKPHSISTISSGRLPPAERRTTGPCRAVFFPVGKISRAGGKTSSGAKGGSNPQARMTAACLAEIL